MILTVFFKACVCHSTLFYNSLEIINNIYPALFITLLLIYVSIASNQSLDGLLQFNIKAHFWAMFASLPEPVEGYASAVLQTP